MAAGDAIIDYRLRLAALGHAVNPGWRGLGAVEATVKRYQGRLEGRAWSRGGIGGILVLSDEFFGGTLIDKARGLSAELGPDWDTPRGLSPGDIPYAVGRGTDGRQAHIPALDGALDGYAWLLRQMSRVRWSQ